jgi:hypothetical protein
LNQVGTVEVLGENRNLELGNGELTDSFQPYEVHLYRLLSKKRG